MGTIAIVAVLVCATLSMLAVPASAQTAEGETPQTSVPDSVVPPSSTPVQPTTPTTAPVTVPGETTTTTTTVPAVTPSLPPEYLDDPRAGYMIDPGETDGLDVGTTQNSFDPQSVTVRPDLVEAARAELFAAQAVLESVRTRLNDQRRDLVLAEQRLATLAKGVRDAVDQTASARQDLAAQAARAYVVGDVDAKLALVQVDDVTDVGVARRYVGALGQANERVLRNYRSLSAKLSQEHRSLATTLATSRSAIAESEEQQDEAAVAVLDASAQLAAYEAGAHAYIKGFAFPIAGEADFIDSWGFPRSGGRWHQGADIFAKHGTPLIAVEDGVLQKVGTVGLGGLRLWLEGESGNHYYYAHLAGFAEGAADGKVVRAGEVVGYVGDTGNARGTPPHLHFEIHPGGLGPVNPYPLLRAAYDARPDLGPTAATGSPPPAGLIPPVGG